MSTELELIAERTGRATNIHIYYAACIGFEHYHQVAPVAPPTPPAKAEDTPTEASSPSIETSLDNGARGHGALEVAVST